MRTSQTGDSNRDRVQSTGESGSAEFAAFSQLQLSQAESIYPDIRQELDLVIDDRLNTIQSGLTVMNDQQQELL